MGVIALIGALMIITGYRIRGLDYIQFLFIPTIFWGIIHYRKIASIDDSHLIVAVIAIFMIGLSLLTTPRLKYTFSSNGYWTYTFVIFAVLMVLLISCLWATPISVKSRMMYIYLMCTGLFLSSLGMVNYTNIVLDNTAPVRYRTTVLKKATRSSGKTSSLEMELKGWIDDKPVNISVSLSIYLKYEVNQELEIDMWPGKLSIPWYQFVGEK